MASDIAQAQEMGKAARIQAFDIVAQANLQGQHFGVIGAKRLDKSSPTPPVTLRSTLISLLFTYAPPPYPPTSLPSLLHYPPPPGVIPRGNFRPYIPTPLSSCPQIRLLKLPIPPQFRCSAF
jgi:hypothetical protein